MNVRNLPKHKVKSKVSKLRPFHLPSMTVKHRYRKRYLAECGHSINEVLY